VDKHSGKEAGAIIGCLKGRICPNSPRPKMTRQVKNKVKSMLIIIFFDIKGIFQKEFVRAGQTANSADYCDILW
jgi:hypothetical protein